LSCVLHRLLCSLFPGLCVKNLTPLHWQENVLRCPVCDRLIAYVYPLHGKYTLHICYPFCFAKPSVVQQIIDSLPHELKVPVAKAPHATIQWELLRDPIEPLMSDTWDDEEAYQKCVTEYINQNKENEMRSILHGNSE